MTKPRYFVLAAVLVASAAPAYAQWKETAKVGEWTAFEGLDEYKQPTCGLYSKAKDSQWQVWWKWIDGVNWFQAQKRGWRILQVTDMPVVLQFDENEPHRGTARSTGLGNAISASFTYDRFKTVLKEFISSKKMQVKFPNGSDPGWSVSLIGSDKIAATFMKCVTNYEKQNQAPQPHQGGTEQKEGRT